MNVFAALAAGLLAAALLVLDAPRLEQFERLNRYGYGDFEVRGDEAGQDGLFLRVNDSSAHGIAVAVVRGDKRRSDVVAYFEAHPLEARAWDAVSQCFSDPNCRRTRYVTRSPGGPRIRTRIGGPADIFHSSKVAGELRLAARGGVSGPAIERVQRTGLHLADIMKLYERGFKIREQGGVKIDDEALSVVVRGVENAAPFRLGDAEIRFWRGTSYLAMYATVDAALDIPAFWEFLGTTDPDVQRALHPYFDVSEEAPEAGTVDAPSDDSGVPREMTALVAYFAGTWDVVVKRGGDEIRGVDYHGSLGTSFDIRDRVVDGAFVSHVVRGLGATGLFEETEYFAHGGSPSHAVGRFDPEAATLILDNPTTSKHLVFESAEAFTTRVFTRTSDGSLELVSVSSHTRRPIEPPAGDDDESASDEGGGAPGEESGEESGG